MRVDADGTPHVEPVTIPGVTDHTEQDSDLEDSDLEDSDAEDMDSEPGLF